MSQSQKRKRDEQELKNTLIISDGSSGVGPVVVTFPALEPAKNTSFKFYYNQERTPKNLLHKGVEIENGIVAGETSTIDLFTGSYDFKSGSQYLVGIRDKKNNKILLRRAPLHVLSRDVKAVKSLESIQRTEHEEWARARNELGEAFGSKKAKLAIKALERNKVDVSAMKDVVGHIQENIEASTAALPSREEAQTVANENRPIPRYDANAASPDQVYSLYDIVPRAELDSIDLSRLLAASEQAKVSCLPYVRSQWINEHLASEFEAAKLNKMNLTINKYGDKELLQKRMSSVSNEIIEGLLERFTEKSRNETKPEMTNESKTRLLTYMCALCLRLDKYATDPTLLASDLSITPATVTKHFKQLGCSVEALSTAERARRGLGPPSTHEPKWCVLRVPLEFPKQKFHRQQR